MRKCKNRMRITFSHDVEMQKMNECCIFAWCRKQHLNENYILAWCSKQHLNEIYIFAWCRNAKIEWVLHFRRMRKCKNWMRNAFFTHEQLRTVLKYYSSRTKLLNRKRSMLKSQIKKLRKKFLSWKSCKTYLKEMADGVMPGIS